MKQMPDISECMNCLCAASRVAARGITAVFDELLRPYGLKGTQFTVLVTLMQTGPMTIGNAAKFMGMDRTTLTRNLGTMEAQGWIHDRGDEKDARSRIISVTAAGEALARKAFPAWQLAQKKVATALGKTNAETLRVISTVQFRV